MTENKLVKTIRILSYSIFIAALTWMMFYLLTIRFTGSEMDKIMVHIMYGMVSGSAIMMAVYAFSLYVQRPQDRYMLIFGVYCLFTALRMQTLAGGFLLLFPDMKPETIPLLKSIFTSGAGLSNFYLTLELFGRRHIRLLGFLAALWLLIINIIGHSFSIVGTPIQNIIGLIAGVPAIIVGFVVVLRSGQMHRGITKLYAVATAFSIFSFSLIMLGIPNFALIWTFLFLIVNALLMSDRYTESHRREKILSERNAMLDSFNQTKTEFLQDMSHEMKGPLTVIATGIDYADREIQKESIDLEKAVAALDNIREETQRLGRMVGSMVSLVSMSGISTNRERIDFTALLRNCAEAYRPALEQRNNRLSVELAPGLPDVFVETDRFVQVITNLLTNAAKHTQDGEIILSADFDDTFITVRVSDNGEGIEQSLLPRIFERGVSGRGGTGYGLYICKTVVEAHGGTIKIENAEVGSGAIVTFTVPVYGGQEGGHRL